jgi:G3E family GTPase
MSRENQLAYLFAEPSGIVIPFELRTQIQVAGRFGKVTPGPVILMTDASAARSPFAEEVHHITIQQVSQSDLLAINKIDNADPEEADWLENSLREIAPEKPLHRVSLHSGEGVPGLLAAVLEMPEGR